MPSVLVSLSWRIHAPLCYNSAACNLHSNTARFVAKKVLFKVCRELTSSQFIPHVQHFALHSGSPKFEFVFQSFFSSDFYCVCLCPQVKILHCRHFISCSFQSRFIIIIIFSYRRKFFSVKHASLQGLLLTV